MAREIYNIQLKKLGETHDSTIYSQQTLAKSLAFLNKLDEAQKLAETALNNSIKYLGDKNPLTMGAYFTLAQIYFKQNKYNQALDKYQVILNKEFIKENNPNHPRLMQAIAEVFEKNQDREKAEEFHIKSVKSFKNVYGEEHKKTIEAQNKYADFLVVIKKNKTTPKPRP